MEAHESLHSRRKIEVPEHADVGQPVTPCQREREEQQQIINMDSPQQTDSEGEDEEDLITPRP